MAFQTLSPQVVIRKLVRDGRRVKAGQTLLEISGPSRALLSAERVALNFVQRLSGVASATSQFVNTVKGTRARILRTPARRRLRLAHRFEKYRPSPAGGGKERHRYVGLFDMSADQGQPSGGVAKRRAERHRRRRGAGAQGFSQAEGRGGGGYAGTGGAGEAEAGADTSFCSTT